MQILNLNINDDLKDWGIERTPKQKTIVWSDKSQEYDVYKIPVDRLVYNLSNGRMFMEAKKFESEQGVTLESLKESDPSHFNDEVENLIWSTNEERNLATKKNIYKYGQLEAGVVLDDGTIVGGNRRFTCIRKLHREHPEDERFNYFLAAIVKVDGEHITKKDLKEYELRDQFGKDEQVGYNVINMNMSIYELIEKKSSSGFDYSSVAELVGKTPGDISKICKTCMLVDEFLTYIGKPEEYSIAEELKIYWPLEPLVAYFQNDGKNLTDLEKIERKHLFFDYLLTLDVSLITQNLRDGLIKKVFKNISDTKDLIKDHKEIIGEKIQTIINTSNNTEDFMESIKELKNSPEAADDSEKYEEKVRKLVNDNQIDIPLKECNKAKSTLEGINLDPLIKASNEIAEDKLNEILNILKEIDNISNSLKIKISSHE